MSLSFDFQSHRAEFSVLLPAFLKAQAVQKSFTIDDFLRLNRP